MKFSKFLIFTLLLNIAALPSLQAFAQETQGSVDPKVLLAVRQERLRRQTEEINEQRVKLAKLSMRLEHALKRRTVSLFIGIPVALAGSAVTVWGLRSLISEFMSKSSSIGNGYGRIFDPLFKAFFGGVTLGGLGIASSGGAYIYISASKAAELKEAVDQARVILDTMRSKFEADKIELEAIRSKETF